MQVMVYDQLDTSAMITHRFTMDEFDSAKKVFGDAARGALKALPTARS